MSTADFSGGAERVALELFHAYRSRGLASWLAVGRKRSDDPDVLAIHPLTQPPPPRRPDDSVRTRIAGPLRRGFRIGARVVQDPRFPVDRYRGRETFGFPASRRVLALPPERPTILHCHNLHGEYFDLRALPRLSSEIPTVLTLHDAWLLSGHCAHSFDCDRWMSGCGNCPDLDIPPTVRRDATASNWSRKSHIFASSRVSIATPCEWLLRRAERSLLAPAIVDARVIPYGIDLSTFTPGERTSARQALGLPENALILMFAANGIRRSPWRHYPTLRAALDLLQMRDAPIICLAVGDSAGVTSVGEVEIRTLPFVRDRGELARLYQAADVYVHPALADTFPNVVLEALACGLPVVASAVGGIPEQVENGRTGVLVPPRDPRSLAAALQQLLDNEQLRSSLGARAATEAHRRFGMDRQVDAYLSLYSAADEAFSYRPAGAQ